MHFSRTHTACACVSRAYALILLVLVLGAAPVQGAGPESGPASQPLSVLNLLQPIPVEVNEAVAQAALNDPLYMEGQSAMPMEEMAGVWSRAFARTGYDYNASLFQALQGAGNEAYLMLVDSGGLSYVIPVLNAIKAGKQDYMAARGWVSTETAEQVQLFGRAIGLLDCPGQKGDGKGSAGASDMSDLGRYCGRVNTFSSQGENVTQVWIDSLEGSYTGEFFFDSSEESCLSLMREGEKLCFDYLGSEGGMHWMAGCSADR